MDSYILLKFVHVIAAVIWVGGGLCFTILTVLAGRDGRRLLSVLDTGAAFGAVAVPSSLIVLLSGGALVWLGAWGMAPWVAVALAATLVSFVIGALFLGPGFGRIAELRAKGDLAGALDIAERLAWPARGEQALLILVVCLMVTKPGWAEMPVIAALALVLFAGVATINMQAGRARLA